MRRIRLEFVGKSNHKGAMPITGSLVNLPLTSLQQINAAAQQCIIAASVRGVTYSIAGRSFTFPDLTTATALLAESQYAIDLQTGARSTMVRANFNPCLGRGSGQGCSYNPALNNQD